MVRKMLYTSSTLCLPGMDRMDNRSRRLVSAALLVGFAFAVEDSRAQSTDAYHAIQVFPVVVDTTSFTQRFHFRTTYNIDAAVILVTYYPADGTANSSPVTCNSVSPAYDGAQTFASLRDLCPALAPGSAFGTLVARDTAGTPFAASSRVNNAAGAGFAVEAFPASDFTIAGTAVTGLRRLAAQTGAPAYQSNCFVGSLAELVPVGSPPLTNVRLSLRSASGQLIGTKDVDVKPGQLIRLLDVFAAAGLPAGDYDNVVATFKASDESGAGLITFCTVQDNSQFGADFRIGKQELSFAGSVPGSHDQAAMRLSYNRFEEPVDNELSGAQLAIGPGSSRNVHIFYFRHPDIVSCMIVDPINYNLVEESFGLEMRLRVLDSGGWNVLAGGSGSTHFFELYLGDKPRHGKGANTIYQIEVESNGLNEEATRPYVVHCASGSGHTYGNLIRKGLPVTF